MTRQEGSPRKGTIVLWNGKITQSLSPQRRVKQFLSSVGTLAQCGGTASVCQVQEGALVNSTSHSPQHPATCNSSVLFRTFSPGTSDHPQRKAKERCLPSSFQLRGDLLTLMSAELTLTRHTCYVSGILCELGISIYGPAA